MNKREQAESRQKVLTLIRRIVMCASVLESCVQIKILKQPYPPDLEGES